MVTFISNSNHLVLPNPELRDKEVMELKVQIDRAMDGSFQSFKDPNITTKFDLNFAHVNRPKMIEVINFLILTAGQIVQYTDMDGNFFNVIILTQPFEETHVGRHNNTFSLLLHRYVDILGTP